jgi:hypothetical protein
MSVIKNKRSESALKVISLCDSMTAYTLRMLCNEKVFPKKSRWLLSGKIADLMNDFMIAVHRANDIFVETQEDAQLRHVFQTKAYSALYTAASVMRVAQTVLQFDMDKLDYWSGMCLDELKLLKAWQRNDDKRYAVKRIDYGQPPE